MKKICSYWSVLLVMYCIRSNPSGSQNGRIIMNPASIWGGTMVATEREVLDFSTPKSPEVAFSGIFTYLKLVKKYYNFAIFQNILCKTYDESLQKQAVDMARQCILCIANTIVVRRSSHICSVSVILAQKIVSVSRSAFSQFLWIFWIPCYCE